MKNDFKVVAVIAAYNEGDIIRQVVGDLIAQGVFVYFVDNQSTDNTIAEVEPFVGRGVIAIESFGGPAGSGQPAQYDWTGILKRKEALGSELEADWFIHHDADEFRESPWPGRDLKSGIETVDALGYNAIDFELLNFPPTHDHFLPGQDVREAFPFFEPGAAFDKPQVRCWKRTPARTSVDLVSSGGHDARFPGRSVFPIRFLLRHYPIRGQAHGQRKIFVDRVPRFSQTERDRGWHIQYQSVAGSPEFVRDALTLTRFDPERVRLDLLIKHRGTEEQSLELDRVGHELEARQEQVNDLMSRLQSNERQVAELASELESNRRLTEAQLNDLNDALVSCRREMETVQSESTRMAEIASSRQARVEALEQSWSWRLTAPGRRVRSWLHRLGGAM